MYIKIGCAALAALSLLSFKTERIAAQNLEITGAAAINSLASPEAIAPKKSVKAAKPKITTYGIYRFRVEDWNWYPTPKANGAYTFETSVLKYGVISSTRLNDLSIEFEQPSIISVPHNASGSGSIGSLGYGASYFTANHNQSASFFIKQAYVRYKMLGNRPDSTLQIGRFTFSDGGETTPADPTIAYLKQTRINDRLISEAFYSNLGRSFDGFRYSSDTRLRNITILGATPTRGAYDLNGWDSLSNIQVGYIASTFTQTSKHDASEGRIFSIYYGDERQKDIKLDNRSTPARTADTKGIHLGAFGGNYVRSFEAGPGRFDGLLWGVGEIGSWGHLTNAAYAYDGELGYQFTHSSWKPWIRAGYSFYSGDGNASDSMHGTYIPILTTALKYAPFPFYTQVNLKDLFGQLIIKPVRKLSLKGEVHSLKLANSHDLWYTGSGAFEQQNFGYSGRTSGGHVNLGTMYDITADYNINRSLTLSLFFGYSNGGDVQAATFTGNEANYSYVQALYKF